MLQAYLLQETTMDRHPARADMYAVGVKRDVVCLVPLQAYLLSVAAEATVHEHTSTVTECAAFGDSTQHVRMRTAVTGCAGRLDNPQLQLVPHWRSAPYLLRRYAKVAAQALTGIWCCGGRQEQPARSSDVCYHAQRC